MVFNKKGIGTQVDWIIGMSIFILYVGLTFIFFKPGIKPVFDSDTMIDIVKEKFEDSSLWTIQKTPIFIEQAKFKITVAGKEIKLSPNDQVQRYIVLKDLDKQLEFSKQEKKTELFLVPTKQEITSMENPTSGTRKDELLKRGIEVERIADEKVRSDYFADVKKRAKQTKEEKSNQNIFIKELSRDYSVGYRFKNKDPEFYTYFPTAASVNSFVLLTSQEKINEADGFEKYNEEDYNDKLKNLDACVVDESISPADVLDGNKCRAKYKVGATEELKGIALKKLLDLNTKEDRDKCGSKVRGYECVKKLWGYPEVKEFKIEIYEKDKIAEFPKGVEPPDNANVFTRNFNDFILSDDGKKTSVTVNFMVW